MSVPIAYLMHACDEALENFALHREAQAANLRKEIKAMQAEAENLEIEAGVAHWLRNNRQEILQSTGKHLPEVVDVRNAPIRKSA